jgi:hypothetical protein
MAQEHSKWRSAQNALLGGEAALKEFHLDDPTRHECIWFSVGGAQCKDAPGWSAVCHTGAQEGSFAAVKTSCVQMGNSATDRGVPATISEMQLFLYVLRLPLFALLLLWCSGRLSKGCEPVPGRPATQEPPSCGIHWSDITKTKILIHCQGQGMGLRAWLLLVHGSPNVVDLQEHRSADANEDL